MHDSLLERPRSVWRRACIHMYMYVIGEAEERLEARLHTHVYICVIREAEERLEARLQKLQAARGQLLVLLTPSRLAPAQLRHRGAELRLVLPAVPVGVVPRELLRVRVSLQVEQQLLEGLLGVGAGVRGRDREP